MQPKKLDQAAWNLILNKTNTLQQIAKQLNTDGYRTERGLKFNVNLLSWYRREGKRAWKDKSSPFVKLVNDYQLSTFDKYHPVPIEIHSNKEENADLIFELTSILSSNLNLDLKLKVLRLTLAD